LSITVGELDEMPESSAVGMLADCCGSSRWVSEMIAARPFGSRDLVFSNAERIWRSLSASDWVEAFEHHPRIGESTAAIAQGERGAEWSSSEQAGITSASDNLRQALAAANERYERRFGYIYIVCAAGKTPEEMLELARKRLRHSSAAEIRVAAEEQRKITRLRLEKLLEEDT
jgi:2-oxo-4-hydroxy-4-carboxy-5-ureidoimidazoline decarboxylase